MNVINELTDLLDDSPALSHQTRDRAKETLMNHIATSLTPESDEAPDPGRVVRQRRRRVAGVALVSVAAAAALVVGVALPTRSPLSARPASAAVAIRAMADAQREVPDTPRDLSDAMPEVAALVPVLSSLPTDGTPADVWTWLDAHCDVASPEIALEPLPGGSDPEVTEKFREFTADRDCGLLSVYVFLQISSPAQTAALLDALAALPKLASIDGRCGPGPNFSGLPGGTWQNFEVSRNGTDVVLSISRTDQATGDLQATLILWQTAKAPC